MNEAIALLPLLNAVMIVSCLFLSSSTKFCQDLKLILRNHTLVAFFSFTFVGCTEILHFFMAPNPYHQDLFHLGRSDHLTVPRMIMAGFFR
jgi:hypothetical protein